MYSEKVCKEIVNSHLFNFAPVFTTPRSGKCEPDFGQTFLRSGKCKPDFGQTFPRSGKCEPDFVQTFLRSGKCEPDFGQAILRSEKCKPDFRADFSEVGIVWAEKRVKIMAFAYLVDKFLTLDK